MFMFRRSRTTTLIKKLLRRRRSNGPPVVERGPMASKDTKEKDVQDLLKTLQELQLENLWTAINSRGSDISQCVLLSHEYPGDPHLLCCQYWRWPDLRQGGELRSLPQCDGAYDVIYTCCNPYHWSRLYTPETPPPPYTRTNEDRIRPEDRAPSEMPLLTRNNAGESLTTSGDSRMHNSSEWCRLAYWEMQERVGPHFPVEPHTVNIFGDVPYGLDGLNLNALSRKNLKTTDSSVKTRAKIGLGITLSNNPGGYIWLYNRSDQPVFVNSLYLDLYNGGIGRDRSDPVRVPADYCLCIHAPEGPQMYGWDNLLKCTNGPIGDPNSIRVSFGKGWGNNYKRSEITCCPCWLEILLAPCR